jgi:hypothetical protein
LKGSLILILLVGLALALPGPAAPGGTPRPVFSRSRPAVAPQSFFAPEDANETLHYDTDPASGVGLTNGGTFWGGVRFTPTTACTLKTVVFYQWNTSNNDYVFVYSENNDTTPGAILDSIAYNGTDSLTWKTANLTTPLVFPAGVDFWVAVRVTQPAGVYPLGVDVGPNVHNHGGFISQNGTRWRNLPESNPALDFNWNIRAIIATAPSPAHDVGVTRVLAPPTNVGVGAYAPACRIVNFGASSETDIPVTCWVDSAGTHVYTKDTTLAGPLAAGDHADLTFAPSWQTGPAGNSYTITMFTALGGDLDNSNDTAQQTITVSARFVVMDHDTGNCKLSVTCLGSIGYDAPPSFDAGSGFRYPKTSSTSSLFYSSLALGTDTGWVVDRYYGHPTSGGPNTDFGVVESLVAIVPPGIGDQHFRGVFSDAGHPSPKGLTVVQNSYMSADAGYDDFVVLDYAITNNGSSEIDGICAGVFADFDVGSNSALDFCFSDTDERFMKMWMQGSPNPTAGLKILAPGWYTNLTAVDHNIWVYPDSCVTDNQKYRFLNGSIVLRNSNRAYDWSMVVSIGPFDLAVGDTQKFAVAVIGASDTAEFRVNAESAQSWYASNLAVAEGGKPAVPVLRIAAAPNPFKRATRISYSALAAGRLDVEAYDPTGRLVDRLAANVKAGPGAIDWSPKRLGAGLYFLKVKVPGKESVIKALLTD